MTNKNKSNLGKITGAVVLAEVGSTVAAMGAVWFAEKCAPNLFEKVSRTFSKKVVEPHLDTAENIFGSLGHDNKAKGTGFAPGTPELSDEQRAHGIAKNSVKLLTTGATNAVTSFIIEKHAEEAMKLTLTNPQRWSGIAVEMGTQLGGIVFMNTALCKQTNQLSNGLKKILMNVGLSEENAEHYGNYLVRWEIPNGLGALVRIAALNKSDKLNRGVGVGLPGH